MFVTMASIVLGGPGVRWLGNRDSGLSRKFAFLICVCLVIYPFFAKPTNFFERFNTIVSADTSTVYQQFRRTQTWIDSRVEAGSLDSDIAESKKAHNERIHNVLHSGRTRKLYLQYGDVLGKSILKKSIEEPSFLYCAGYAMNHVVWIGSLIALSCSFLPQGGLMTCILILLGMFCLELESRFIDADSIYTYFFFLNASEWATFEILVAMKQAFAGIVCGIVLIATVYVSPHGSERTKTNLRNLLKSNAALVAVMKDPAITEFKMQKDEVYLGENDVNINRIIISLISGIAIIAAVFVTSE